MKQNKDMWLFSFFYEIESLDKKETWSCKAATEEDARLRVKSIIADFEMVEEEEVTVGALAGEPRKAEDVYYECEGCT